eukprot:SM000021S06416  [mRNA]  locus=s21:118207:120178:+ [translate_table: standard]
MCAARGPAVQRAPLKQRDHSVDLASRLGKTQVVTQVTPLSQQLFKICVLAALELTVVPAGGPVAGAPQAGYYCNVCECVVKDSANYLDHINGKKHQRALGMSMRVERSNVHQVRDRLEELKRKKEQISTLTEKDFDARILKQQEEEEERKRQRKERKKEKKKEKAGEGLPAADVDVDVAALMGFGGFGTTKA